jgi:hypothetical protein
MTPKYWIGLGIAIIFGLMYLVYADRPYRAAEQERAIILPSIHGRGMSKGTPGSISLRRDSVGRHINQT